MATVMHVVERYLDLSSGFVHAQVARSRHRAVVLSIEAPQNLDAFPLSDVASVPALARRLPGRFGERATRAAVLRHAVGHGAAIAHAHFGYALPYTRIVRRRRGIPVVVSLHGHDATAWAAASPWAYTPSPTLVDAVIAPSRWLADRATALGFRDEQIRIIPSGVDTTAFVATPPADGPPVVAFVGRLVEKKGVDTLMKAWPVVRGAVPDARLRVLGEGPLGEIVRGDGVERVLPVAARRHDQVRTLFRDAAVVASPSQTAPDGDAESLLLVNLEAQAAGRPVVTTRHGGIPEFVAEGETATVVPERNAGALADALVALLRDRDLAARMGAAGPAVAARFDATAMAGRVDDLYDELLDRPPPRPSRRHRRDA